MPDNRCFLLHMTSGTYSYRRLASACKSSSSSTSMVCRVPHFYMSRYQNDKRFIGIVTCIPSGSTSSTAQFLILGKIDGLEPATMLYSSPKLCSMPDMPFDAQ